MYFQNIYEKFTVMESDRLECGNWGGWKILLAKKQQGSVAVYKWMLVCASCMLSEWLAFPNACGPCPLFHEVLSPPLPPFFPVLNQL